MASRTQTTGVQGYVIAPAKADAIRAGHVAERQREQGRIAAAATAGKVGDIVTKLRDEGVKVHRPIAGWRGLPKPHLTGDRYDADIEGRSGERSHFKLVGQPDGSVHCQHLIKEGFRGWTPKPGRDQPRLDPDAAVAWMMSEIRELGAEKQGHQVS